MKSLTPLLGILLLLPLSPFAQSANVPPAPLDNSGFEDRHPEGMFSSIVTAHGQEMVMGQARSFQIVPVKPTKTFTQTCPRSSSSFPSSSTIASSRSAAAGWLKGAREYPRTTSSAPTP